LTKILFREYWKILPEFVHTSEDFREHIKGTTAGIVIGDRALEQRQISAYIYDLGEAWKSFTGLPFVFASWISNKDLRTDFIREFDTANSIGVKNLDALLMDLQYDFFDLRLYYTKYISFDLNAQKIKGLELFLEKLNV
jgi:chorismate dehydratase